MKKKLGIIQSRGLGDIIIALPIALHYHEQGYHVHWPIIEQWTEQMNIAAPWVKWIPITPDQGPFFYDIPMQRLKNFGCDEIICLYQALTGHPDFTQRPEFQITGFDQIKYHIAKVPFKKKWTLNKCITRDYTRENNLLTQLEIDIDKPYAVIHTQGSNYSTQIDKQWIPPEWRIIEITDLTNSVFDWLTILENAHGIIVIDSVFANLIDQLAISDTVDSYFLPRSHIQLTPVLGSAWTILHPDEDTTKKIAIFHAN
jgi:hypothetical protein